MNLILSTTNDPYLNLATEEFLLKSSDFDFIFLYVNRPSVIVGKHQIVQKEIDAKYVYDNNILIARRLSGGGTVYHDEGNLNFSFIRSNKSRESVSYKEITQSICDFLHSIRIQVSLSERNDFLLNGKKVSGSAMHIFKNRMLAHATLLVNCNLNLLSNSLSGNAGRFTDKSISSVRSKVMNLNELNPGLTASLLTQGYTSYLQKHHEAGMRPHTLTKKDHKEIEQISKDKYSTDEWIYNYSPKYIYRNSFTVDNTTITYELEIEKGLIRSAKIEQMSQIDDTIYLLINTIIGKYHNLDSLLNWFNAGSQSPVERLLFASLF